MSSPPEHYPTAKIARPARAPIGPRQAPGSQGWGYALWGLPPLAIALVTWPGSQPPSLAQALIPITVVTVWALGLARLPERQLPLTARRSAVLVLTLLVIRYLSWRLTSTLNFETPASGAISLLMLMAELWLLITGFIPLGLTWAGQPPIEQEANQAADVLQQQIEQGLQPVPSVDVVIPSCGEPLAVVERSLRGCLALDYPRFQVWLLDDSGRDALRQLSQDLGCRYLSRCDRHHAKAGNLNHALPHLQGELLVVFDADVVPVQSFLRRTVGLFQDPRVGFVQTPQSYMTADPVIRNLRLEQWLMPDEEAFYRWVEPTRQAVGAVVCAGTSFVMRRSALNRIGGFETATTSEDLATGIRLTAAGYRNLYLDEKLSAGLAPLTLSAMARQRSRWASGTLQTLSTPANPLRIAGLRPVQRLAYLEGILHWLNGIPQLLLMLMPLSLGLLGIVPIRVEGHALLAMAVPLYLGNLLLARWFSRDARSALLPELYRWVFLVPILTAVIRTLRGRPLHFRVTPKSRPSGQASAPSWGLMLPLLGLLALQVLNLSHLLWGTGPATTQAFSDASRQFSLFWSSISVLLLLASIRICWDRPQTDDNPWFALESAPVQLRAQSQWLPARLLSISESGLELALEQGPGQTVLQNPNQPLQLFWPATLTEPLPLQVQAVRQPGAAILIGACWRPLTPEQREQLQTLLYRRPNLWPVRQAPNELLGWLAVGKRLLQRMPSQGWFHHSRLPLRYPHVTPPLDHSGRAPSW